MFNQIVAIGNLGGDPELKYMQDSTAVCSFSLGTKNRDATLWIKCSVWGTQAETFNQYMKKGSKVQIVGTITPDKATGNPRAYLRQDGSPAASLDVRVSSFTFLDSKGDTQPQAQAQTAPTAEVNEDDIPF
jgi:single-strand DNA-binding protein